MDSRADHLRRGSPRACSREPIGRPSRQSDTLLLAAVQILQTRKGLSVNGVEAASYLQYGELGILLAVLVLILPALFLLIYRLNVANREAERDQRTSFVATIDRLADAFREESTENRKHCSEELSRIADSFERATAISEQRMETIVKAIRGL